MSVVVMLMIGGWIATLLMVGVCALHESGNLLKIRRGVVSRHLETSTVQVSAEEDLQPERGNAA